MRSAERHLVDLFFLVGKEETQGGVLLLVRTGSGFALTPKTKGTPPAVVKSRRLYNRLCRFFPHS